VINVAAGFLTLALPRAKDLKIVGGLTASPTEISSHKSLGRHEVQLHNC
jgi:hypothetical protein